MKRMFKYFAAVLTAAILCLALVGCGNKTKYNYKGSSVLVDSQPDPHFTTDDTMETMYKDSYIEVGGGEIVWTIKDMSQTMTYTMDGDKYVLSGEYVQLIMTQMSDCLTFVMYGIETEEGFDIVEEYDDTNHHYKLTMSFTKA